MGSLNGTYFAYYTFVRDDGLESSLSPVSGNFLLTNRAQVDYSSIAVSDDPRVTARRIYRNTNGQARTVYLDVEIADNVTTTATSTTGDVLLGVSEPFALFDNAGIPQAHINDPPPDTKAFLVYSLDRVFAMGFTEYAEGSCETQTGSAVVTGVGTEWKANWVGRYIYIDGADATYEIQSVDVSAQTITLTENYTGTTDLFAGYAIRPSPGECVAMYWSKAGQPEHWFPFDALAIPDDDEVSGGLALYGFLYVLKKRAIYRFTAQNDPALDGFIFLSTKRGCINARCAVAVDDMAYLLDERGVHKFSGGQNSQEISANIQDLFRDGSETPINWSAAKYFHASHSPGESTVRFFVTFRGDYLAHHALCYCYTLDRWWIQDYNRPIGSSALGQANRKVHGWGSGGEQVYYGSDADTIFSSLQGTPDVIESSTSQTQTVVSSTLCTVSFDGTSTADMAGAPVVHRSQASGTMQTRRIVSVSGNTLTVHPPWLSLPDAGDEVILGGFAYRWLSGGVRFVNAEKEEERSLEVMFSRNVGSKIDLAIYNDFSGALKSVVTIYPRDNFLVGTQKDRLTQRVDMGKKEAFAFLRFDGHRELTVDGRRVMRAELTGVGGNSTDSIDSVLLKGVSVGQ